MIKMEKTHLALLVALMLVDVTLQSDKRKRQTNPCPAGWTYVSDLGKCYGFTKTKSQWVKAVGICHGLNAKLVQPKSQSEMDAIKGQMISRNTGAVWTGGYTIDTNGEWRWFDGNTPIGGYRPWHGNNPDNYQDNEHCLEIRATWNDNDCNLENAVACEIRPQSNKLDVIHTPGYIELSITPQTEGRSF